MRVGVDTGGTFTDVVAADGRVVKVLSTPDDPGAAIRAAVDELGAGHPGELLHGTTVATNAVLQRRGADVWLVTTAGFADVIEIARQDRPALYDERVQRPASLVPRHRRVEVRGRLDADGREIAALELGDLDAVPDDAEAVAVCLLHADLGAGHERAVAQRLRGRGLDVTCSHELSPEFREYERTVTTTANAFLRPVFRRYLGGIVGVAEDLGVMTSAGGLLDATVAAAEPARLLLSGPAAGVRAAAAVAAANGIADAITFDMGGTSTDVCLVLGGEPEVAAQRRIGGLPVRLPALDVHTIGAGGGSLAWIDDGGALRVGPTSAGADPGPVSYARGGTVPTVTDADLVVGNIDADRPFPALGHLDADAAGAAFARAGIDPEGVVAVVDVAMEQALRAVSVERGVDPRGLALVAFGGAGPLHACALAEALDIPRVVVPDLAGVLSAVGLQLAPRQHDLVRSWPRPADPTGLAAAAAELGEEARALARRPDLAVVVTAVDCRYVGQSHELTVPTPDDFHAEHRRRNGYADPSTPVEVIAVRARVSEPPPLRLDDLPVRSRSTVRGPATVTESDCTILVRHGWEARPGRSGALVLERT